MVEWQVGSRTSHKPACDALTLTMVRSSSGKSADGRDLRDDLVALAFGRDTRPSGQRRDLRWDRPTSEESGRQHGALGGPRLAGSSGGLIVTS
jgi:hypothetical protein